MQGACRISKAKSTTWDVAACRKGIAAQELQHLGSCHEALMGHDHHRAGLAQEWVLLQLQVSNARWRILGQARRVQTAAVPRLQKLSLHTALALAGS